MKKPTRFSTIGGGWGNSAPTTVATSPSHNSVMPTDKSYYLGPRFIRTQSRLPRIRLGWNRPVEGARGFFPQRRRAHEWHHGVSVRASGRPIMNQGPFPSPTPCGGRVEHHRRPRSVRDIPPKVSHRVSLCTFGTSSDSGPPGGCLA